MKKRRQNSTGAKRMREQGYLRCDVWLPPAHAAWLRDKAGRYGLPLSTFLRLLALAFGATTEQRRSIRLGSPDHEVKATDRLCELLPDFMDLQARSRSDVQELSNAELARLAKEELEGKRKVRDL